MLPQPLITTPPEPFVQHVNETRCDVTPRPGVELFRDFVLNRLGGLDLGIGRKCQRGRSGHYSQRAWDWGMLASNPDEHARVDELLNWLLANDQELFRRAGLAYVIWDGQVYGSRSRMWKPYDGSDAHQSHVHFSFGNAGADAKTSLYTWMLTGQPTLPLPPPATQPTAQPAKEASLALPIATFITALLGTTAYMHRKALVRRIKGWTRTRA